ncbi:BMP family ABC transporter substrate-binding protein [Microcella daejeonensis]|uniref:BMP family lipoprotein n=1 Tax=Microcella daejeonensis TaxID=2994971 RepID=UPI002271D42F|nr:BMP family ABC transporter substrate-binding protein [Microcella daejeonensis]WAB84084.1 BMP family ABC transporter substrate-binding protein [Microcella daejeonensis]
MNFTSRKAAVSGLAMLGASALVLAGCAAAPEEGGTAGPTDEALDFLPCIVSDAGGFDDRSFNQAGFEGLERAAEELGVEFTDVQSQDENAYGPNVQSLVDEGCDLIITVGFLLEEATAEASAANPDINFAIIDSAVEGDNVKPIQFDTVQAAFLAGYAAASYSETGVVGTFGGLPIPPVTIFMDGFVQGVEYHNEVNGTDVQALGWDFEAQDGAFTGGFDAGTEALTVAQGLLDQNVDVLLPVGGPIYQSAAEAIRDSGREVALLGVDSDVFETDPSVGDLLLTSVLKNISNGVYDVVMAAGEGNFDNSPYVGTLENEGVGLAPFHDFESLVDAELQAQLDEITAGIVDGSIEVSSPASPGQ